GGGPRPQRPAGVWKGAGLKGGRAGLATLLESREPPQLGGTLAGARGDTRRTVDSHRELRDLRALLAHHLASLREPALCPVELLLERAQPRARGIQVDADSTEQAEPGNRQDEPTRA